jgi:hypothetical protein
MQHFLRWFFPHAIFLVSLFSVVSCTVNSPNLANLRPVDVDTTTPFPLDRGSRSSAPSSYKGLPLEMAERGQPHIEPVEDRIGLLCIGMSNGNIECEDFIATVERAIARGEVNPQVRVVNCAVGGHAIERWNDPAYAEILWGACIQEKIPAAGLRPDQIRVVWHKAASQFTTDPAGNLLPPYPDPASDYFRFYDSLSTFATRLQEKFPSVQAVYTSSRSYGGFARRDRRSEPLSFEEGMALNEWLNNQPDPSPVWFGWGPYIWAPDCASGVTNRSNVCYVRSDFRDDGIHPTREATGKISQMLHSRFMEDGWYRRTDTMGKE